MNVARSFTRAATRSMPRLTGVHAQSARASQRRWGISRGPGAQDGFDLWTKVAQKNKCTNVNLPLFYYRRHGTNLTTDSQRIINARQQIKKDAIRDRLANQRPLIAVIPYRRNFDFVMDLWSARIGSGSLLDRAIEVCCSSDMFDHDIVTGDNPDAEPLSQGTQIPGFAFFPATRIARSVPKASRPRWSGSRAQLDPDLNGITSSATIQSPFVTVDTLRGSRLHPCDERRR